MSVKELKKVLKDRNVDISGAVEKEDLIRLAVETRPAGGNSSNGGTSGRAKSDKGRTRSRSGDLRASSAMSP